MILSASSRENFFSPSEICQVVSFKAVLSHSLNLLVAGGPAVCALDIFGNRWQISVEGADSSLVCESRSPGLIEIRVYEVKGGSH